ncbi:hypothetical protein OROGR_027793 [Orobanche gracilis]
MGMGAQRMDETGVMKVKEHDFRLFTNDFDGRNFICDAQFCKLYHGYIPQGWNGFEAREVTIKVWVETTRFNEHLHEGKAELTLRFIKLLENFITETDFLTSTKATSCPYFPRLIAKCYDEDNKFLGVVYDLKSSNTLGNFVDKADSNPFLFNYFNLTPSPRPVGSNGKCRNSCYGAMAYADINFIYTGRMPEAADVFAFGVILCELLYKRKVDERLRVDHKLKMNHKLKVDHKVYSVMELFLYVDARRDYPLQKSRSNGLARGSLCGIPVPTRGISKRQKEYSFVDKSFEEDPSFNALDGPKISKLARFCVDENPIIRPNIQAVLKWLEELHAVRDHDMMHKPYQVV